MRDFLEDHGITAYPKTTGNRGLHLYVRVEPAGTPSARQAAVSVARAMEARRPELITAAWWKEERGPGSSSTSTRTPRTRPFFGVVRAGPAGAQVSTPFRWDELPTVHPDHLTLATVPARADAR